ncbi:MAG: hypothetical protein QF645_01380, partial [Planctomycetota bacterium]|nr:hypothetical protein [Planctomycetota bacterium]
SYPTKSIALDPKRERLFMARSDGVVGGRVVIYDSSLKKMGEILEGTSAHTLQWDSVRDALIVLTAPKNAQGEILVVWKGDDSQMDSYPAPYEGGAAPSQIAVEPGGAFYVGGKNLWKIDANGAVEWKSVLPSTASAMEVSAEEVGVLYQHGLLSEEDRYVSRFETYASDTGALFVRRKVRFEASRMDVNRTTGEFVVGNGGDSSITILPVGEEAGKTVRVGSSAEDVLLTSDGERLLILNRLGGSEMIERNLKTGESRVVGAGFWPMKMAVRETEDRLYVMNHFETKLSILRLSDLEAVGEFSLGLPTCVGDTIAEMAFDSAGTILACLVCEQGKVVVVDTVDSKIVNTITLAEPNDSYGPGRFQGAVDGEKKRIYVYVDKEQLLYRLDGSNDYEVGKSASVIPGEVARNGYALSGVFYSPLLKLLFVNDLVVHPTTLKTITSLEGVSRVVAEEPGVIYAQRRGADLKEYLVRIDSDTLEVISSDYILSTEKMASYISFDFKNRKYAVSNPAEAEVTVSDLE